MEKKTRNNTQAVAGVNSQIRSSESTDSEQHNESDREAKRVTRRPGKPGKQTPREEVGRYHGSSVTPDSQPTFLSLVRGIRTQQPHLCGEPVTLFLTIKCQPIAKFLNAGMLLLSNASFG